MIARWWRDRRMRRRWSKVPENKRCNAVPGCRNQAVAYYSPIDRSRSAEQQRHCFGHPPEHMRAARKRVCPECCRPFWPDALHLDCETSVVVR